MWDDDGENIVEQLDGIDDCELAMAGYKFAILRWPKAAIIIGAGDYREGWFLIDDDTIELNDSIGWEPLIQEVDQAWFEKATDRPTPETPGFP